MNKSNNSGDEISGIRYLELKLKLVAYMPHIVTGILLTLQIEFGGHLFLQTYITSEFQNMRITI